MIEHVVEVDAAARRNVGIHLDAGEREQRVDQARHARSLLGHDGKEAFARPGIVLGGALQRLDEAAQRGKWSPEFVARIGNEIGAHLVDALDLGQIPQQHEDVAVGLRSAGERRHGRGHASANGNPLGIGHGDGAAAQRCRADGVQEFRGADHRGDMAAFAQRGEEPPCRSVAVEHLARRIKQDGRIRQGLGDHPHARARPRRTRQPRELVTFGVIDLLTRQKRDRGDEAQECGDGEGEREMGDDHERRHDHGDRDN